MDKTYPTAEAPEVEPFTSTYQNQVDNLNRIIGGQAEHINALKREIEWHKQVIMNLSRRND